MKNPDLPFWAVSSAAIQPEAQTPAARVDRPAVRIDRPVVKPPWLELLDEPQGLRLRGGALSKIVVNGSAYECGKLACAGCRDLLLPEHAQVAEGTAGVLRIFLEKTLHFRGHPPAPLDLRTARGEMGCRYRREGDLLELDTFGQFSTPDGSARVTLLVQVPAEVNVTRRAAIPATGATFTGTWYAEEGRPASEGWTDLPTRPDSDLTAAPRCGGCGSRRTRLCLSKGIYRCCMDCDHRAEEKRS
ncbi:MAG TPA: hypothetical protein VGO93_19970 [Candidatus Xenobia bacterium]